MNDRTKHVVRAIAAIGLAIALSGCVIYPAYGPYYRPYYRPFYY